MTISPNKFKALFSDLCHSKGRQFNEEMGVVYFKHLRGQDKDILEKVIVEMTKTFATIPTIAQIEAACREERHKADNVFKGHPWQREETGEAIPFKDVLEEIEKGKDKRMAGVMRFLKGGK